MYVLTLVKWEPGTQYFKIEKNNCQTKKNLLTYFPLEFSQVPQELPIHQESSARELIFLESVQ